MGKTRKIAVNDRLVVKCIVACINAGGEPDFFFCLIDCTPAQYDEGYHYDAAKTAAKDHDYGGAMVVYDENDGPKFLFDHFAQKWSAPIVI